MEQMTRQEILQRINENEKRGVFDEHVDPIDWDNALPVDENFNYIRKGFKQFILNNFFIKPYTFKTAVLGFHTKVIGRKNLRGIKNAIVTCNHVDKFDCLVAKHGLRGHKLHITAGNFNNQKGKFGEYMRVGGLMPFAPNYSGMRNFDKAMEYFLTHKNYVLFYPEQAMWWHYKKPRPYKNGAFHYATKFNVPVIPMFITMKDSKKIDKNTGYPKQIFTLHIMPAFYPDKNLNKQENVEYLKKSAYNACKAKYEEVYKIPLAYLCDKKNKEEKC